MKNNFASVNISWIYAISAIIFFAACWFSVGFQHGDEHFQIFEFAGSLLGWNSENEMAWEYHKQMRPSLQPSFTALFIYIFNAIGIWDTFFQAFLFRCFSAGILFYAVYRFLKSQQLHLQPWAITFHYLFCLTPFIAARYSSEGLSASMILLMLSFTYSTKKNDYLLIGIFGGLAFALRFQSAFALVGLAIWYLISKKFNWREVVLLLSGFLVIQMTAACLDYNFYGAWTLPSYNYFYQNIILAKASNYGVDPWYYYFIKFIKKGYWLPGILLLFIGLRFTWKNPKSIITWVFWIFLLGHTAIGHKETRFLFPIAILIPYIVYQQLFQNYSISYKRILLCIFVITNCLYIPAYIFFPASQEISVLKFLEKKYTPTKFTLYYDGENNPYEDFGLRNKYQGKKQPIFIAQQNFDTLNVKLPAVWISYRCTEKTKEIGHYQLVRIYQTYPYWLVEKKNINGWLNRTTVHTVYEIRKR